MPQPDRESLIAEGVGLIAAGEPVAKAALQVGIPKSTLHDAYLRVLGPDAPDAHDLRRKADERIMATAYCVAEQVLGRMADEASDADHKTVTAWAEVSSKVLARMRGWDAKASSSSEIAPRWLGALSQVLEQGGATLTVTLEPRETGDNARDSE